MNSIIQKYLSGSSTEKEQKALLDWIRQGNHLSEFQAIKREWKDRIRHEALPSDYQDSWNTLQTAIFGSMQSNLQRTQRTLRFFRVAAIFVLLVSIPSLFYFLSQTGIDSPLTYTTVSADFGQISKVMLPDSSVIWINSGSRIKYNNQFSSTNRDIELIGEAYFKVNKNKDLPMIVNSSGLQVKVIGTQFCISAYPEENSAMVILESGKIELTSSTDSKFKQEMNPGELLHFNKDKKTFSINTVNTELYTSWKDGLINVYNLPLSEVIVKLERRYNQNFIIDEAIKDLPYTFTIKNENLNSILSLMEKITPVDVIQHGPVIELKYNQSKNNKTNNWVPLWWFAEILKSEEGAHKKIFQPQSRERKYRNKPNV